MKPHGVVKCPVATRMGLFIINKFAVSHHEKVPSGWLDPSPTSGLERRGSTLEILKFSCHLPAQIALRGWVHKKYQSVFPKQLV